MTTVNEIEYIGYLLKEASNYDLQAEVVVFALSAMQSDPELSIERAMEIGFQEWVK